MKTANFFDKAALGASTILKGFQWNSFVDTLAATSLGIHFDEQVAGTYEGRTSLELTVNLLSRLFPKIAIDPVGEKAQSFGTELAATAQRINPDIQVLRH